MSAASWQISSSPYNGSLGRTNGTAYGSFFKSSGSASTDTGNYTSRTLTSIPSKMFTGYEPPTRGEKYATVTASDIQKIVDAALNKGPEKSVIPVVSDLGRIANDSTKPLFADHLNRNYYSGHPRDSSSAHLAYTKLDSSTTVSNCRPYSSSILSRDTVIDNVYTKLERSNTTLGISSNVPAESLANKENFNSKGLVTPYYGYDRMSSATTAAIAAHDSLAKTAHAELPLGASATSTKYISEKANYNTHQKYSEESKVLPFSSYKSHQSSVLKDSYLSKTSADLDLDRRYTTGNDVTGIYTLTAPSYRLYSSRAKSYLDPSPASLSDTSSPADSTVSPNASRYLDSVVPRFLAPSPPKTPFPGRQDVVLSKNPMTGSRDPLNKLSLNTDLANDAVSKPPLTSNGMDINASIKITSPRDRYTGNQVSPSSTNISQSTTDGYSTNLKESLASWPEPASGQLPISATSGKRSILKRISSYGGAADSYTTRTFSGINPKDIPLLNGYRSEKLPPLSQLPSGSSKRTGSGSKRVTFNFNNNTNHSYEATVYENDEPYYSPYLWL